MRDDFPERRWFWATLALSTISIIGLVFAIWELLESHFFRDVDYLTLHYLYVSRGVVSSLLLAFWAAWFVLRARRASERELRRSRARYLGILNCSPAAIALFDSDLIVAEWNAAAEDLYGYTRPEVLGNKLPTIPAEKQSEMQAFLAQASEGKPVLDVETRYSRPCSAPANSAHLICCWGSPPGSHGIGKGPPRFSSSGGSPRITPSSMCMRSTLLW